MSCFLKTARCTSFGYIYGNEIVHSEEIQMIGYWSFSSDFLSQKLYLGSQSWFALWSFVNRIPIYTWIYCFSWLKWTVCIFESGTSRGNTVVSLYGINSPCYSYFLKIFRTFSIKWVIEISFWVLLLESRKNSAEILIGIIQYV